MKPFFSIVIPCCDVAKYVGECLDSVKSQPFADWECLVGVEESRDNTEEIVRGYAAEDPRIKVFTGPRSGSCSASRNAALDMASGEYVMFLDGDDTIAEGSLKRLHDLVSARPGADMYPCAIRVYEDAGGREVEVRDNYPEGFSDELTGVEATLLTERHLRRPPCPMLQMTVFRRMFLADNGLKCVYGLRRQDSEFSPRALYLAKRVIPLHEQFYLYRLRESAVGSSAKGAGYFHGDWAVIMRSLLAFHAKVSSEAGFDRRVSECWARLWIPWLLFFWFSPRKMSAIKRERRLETLKTLFAGGFGDLDKLLASATPAKRIAGWWVRAFVEKPAMRGAAELFFRLYFAASEITH